MPLITFDQALARVPPDRVPHVLLGNGFSRACRNDIFDYGALFDRADFNHLSPLAREAFGILGTRDFEVVMRALKDAAKLIRLYAPALPDVADPHIDFAGILHTRDRHEGRRGHHAAEPAEIGVMHDELLSLSAGQ